MRIPASAGKGSATCSAIATFLWRPTEGISTPWPNATIPPMPSAPWTVTTPASKSLPAEPPKRSILSPATTSKSSVPCSVAITRSGGFSNPDIRANSRTLLISTTSPNPSVKSAKVTRILNRCHVYGLIAKIRHSRRWCVTKRIAMSAAIQLRDVQFPISHFEGCRLTFLCETRRRQR
jgi:hypothetical protein